MPRPFVTRNISTDPKTTYFKPRGVPLCELEEVILQCDELEALKLAHLDELYHEKAAQKMDVSRQTFDRILITAHKKISDAVVNGKALKVTCGNMTHVASSGRQRGAGGRRGRCFHQRTK